MQNKKSNKSQEIIVAVSGGFDPVHVGHLRMFTEAKKLGTKLIVILNCDAWLVRKKGRVFMPQEERAEIIRGFRCVDDVFILESDRHDVSEAIEKIRPHIFANGGDRDEVDAANPDSSLYKDISTCKKLGIKMVFNVGGGKVRSSRELLRVYAEGDVLSKHIWRID